MSDKKQIKKAARNVKRARTNTKTQKRTGWWNRVWSIVCWPFRKLALACKIVWNWIRNLELVGLLNLTLLVAIIVLFTMLIIDLLGCRKENIIVVTNSPKTSMCLGEENIKNYCAGGLLLAHSIAYVGNETEKFISNINADIFFFSSRG